MANELPPTHTFATLQSKRIGNRADYSSVSIHAKRVSDGKRVFFSVTTLDDGISFVDGCFKSLMPYEGLTSHITPTEATFEDETDSGIVLSRLAFVRTPHGALRVVNHQHEGGTTERVIADTPPAVMDRLEAVVNSAQLRTLAAKAKKKKVKK